MKSGVDSYGADNVFGGGERIDCRGCGETVEGEGMEVGERRGSWIKNQRIRKGKTILGVMIDQLGMLFLLVLSLILQLG